jgi:uncharacterized protein YndB with AHSA1/START domain
MTKIERSIVIDRPAAEVFAFTHDPSKDALWQTTLVESQPLADGPMRVGMKMRETRRFLGTRVEITREITAYEPPRRSTFDTVSGPVPMRGEYTIEPVDGATKLTATGELDAHWFFKLAEPVFARMATRELESSLAQLKDLLEAANVTDALADERVLRGALRD